MECEWRYFIVLNNENNDYVSDCEEPGEGLPLCGRDFNVAKYFLSPKELVEWARKNTSLVLEEGEYHIEGHYLPSNV